MIKAVFLDFDGTIYSHKSKTIPDSTIAAIKKLQEKNILVVLCTGRTLPEMFWFDLKGLKFDGQILANGQIITDKENIIAEYPIEGELKDKILKIFNEKKIGTYLSTTNGIYLNIVNDAVLKAQENVSSPIPPIDEYQNEKLYMASCFYDDEKTLLEIEKLQDVADICFWSFNAVDIVPVGISKAKAIKEFCNLFNIKKEETLAIGDGDNDCEMIEECQIGICMGNGIEELKRVADYITDDIDDDGIYNALKHYQLI